MHLYYVGLLIVVLAGCECHSSTDVYVMENAFADQICPADQIEFQTVTRSAVSCGRRCAETPGCTSLVYHQNNKTCFGIKSNNPFSASYPLLGAMFYRPDGNSQMTIAMSTPGSTSGSTVGSTSQNITTTTSTTTTTTPTATTPTIKTTITTTTTSTTPTTTTTTATSTTTTTPSTTTTRPTTPTTTIASPLTTQTTTLTTPATTTTQTTTTTTPTTPATTTSPTTTAATTTTAPTTTTTTTAAATTTPLTTQTTTPTTTSTTTIDPGTPMVIGVADSPLTASSYWSEDPGYIASDVKLNNTLTGWAPANKSTEQYIQVDFLHHVQATHVITKGIMEYPEWVKSYKVLTSTDCVSFIAVQDDLEKDKIFPGNVDQDSEVMNALVPPVICRCFRINPQTWWQWISLRFEVLGHVV